MTLKPLKDFTELKLLLDALLPSTAPCASSAIATAERQHFELL